MIRALATIVASTTVLSIVCGSPAAADRPDRGVAVVTTDNETLVLYDDDAGGNASGDDPAIWCTPATRGSRSSS